MVAISCHSYLNSLRIFFFIALAGFYISAAEMNRVSSGIFSFPFSNGAGWNGYAVEKLSIDDRRNVTFLAPMPQHENSVAARFVASYLGYDGKVYQLHSGVDEISAMFGTALRNTNAEIVQSDSSTYAVLCDERLSSASATTSVILYLQNKDSILDKVVLGQSPKCIASECHLAIGDGRLLVYGHNLGIFLYDISGNKFQKEHDFTQEFEYNGNFIGMPKKADCIFFAANRNGYGLNAGQNGIFRYDINNGDISLIAKGGRLALDTHVAVSGDGTTVAFRGLDNAIEIMRNDNGNWIHRETYPITDKECCFPVINGNGRFVAYQCKNENRESIKVFDTFAWKTSMTIESQAGGCYRPALSPDGNYIALTSNGTDDGTYQVFYTQNNVSTSGDNWMLMDLKKGWSLKAVHFTLDDTSLEKLENIGCVWFWNGTKFTPNKEKIKAGMGFWINSAADVHIYLSGTQDVPQTLRRGWNLISPNAYSGDIRDKTLFRLMNSCYVRICQDEIKENNQDAVWLFVP